MVVSVGSRLLVADYLLVHVRLEEPWVRVLLHESLNTPLRVVEDVLARVAEAGQGSNPSL